MGHRVTLIPGDGTGPELTEATRRVLEATGVLLDWDVRQAGVEIMEEAGTPLPQDTLDSVRRLMGPGPVTDGAPVARSGKTGSCAAPRACRRGAGGRCSAEQRRM